MSIALERASRLDQGGVLHTSTESGSHRQRLPALSINAQAYLGSRRHGETTLSERPAMTMKAGLLSASIIYPQRMRSYDVPEGCRLTSTMGAVAVGVSVHMERGPWRLHNASLRTQEVLFQIWEALNQSVIVIVSVGLHDALELPLHAWRGLNTHLDCLNLAVHELILGSCSLEPVPR